MKKKALKVYIISHNLTIYNKWFVIPTLIEALVDQCVFLPDSSIHTKFQFISSDDNGSAILNPAICQTKVFVDFKISVDLLFFPENKKTPY